jgi:hypothetical protein
LEREAQSTDRPAERAGRFAKGALAALVVKILPSKTTSTIAFVNGP